MNHDTTRSAIEDGPDIDEDDTEAGDECDRCEGWGGWSETVEGPDGRDIENTWLCHNCDGTGTLP